MLQPDILLADEAFGHLDEVTAAELRETFLALARECGSTAILITHQLEEAIGVGDRIVVFGKSAKLLADIHVAQWEKTRIRGAARGDPGDAAGQQSRSAAGCDRGLVIDLDLASVCPGKVGNRFSEKDKNAQKTQEFERIPGSS